MLYDYPEMTELTSPVGGRSLYLSTFTRNQLSLSADRGVTVLSLASSNAIQTLQAEYYYGQYLRACRTGGMAAVCTLDHFSNLIAARPENRNLLLALDPAIFLSAMDRWRNAFLVGKDQPVMGVSDDELHRINIPTTIVPYYDRMHPYTTSVHAHKTIPNSRFFDFNPLRRENMDITPIDVEHDEDMVVSILCEMYKK